eukprot:CAMPEP_0177459130 /NCGR_PEP_ID=MMETSP0369-20130122/13930_1 /TAXON_ID=447022 ORGANISM="Scrippsiella hangoei-like, Strain SHHI-4" /NCGR_SAMPLE_ID=MMETSP0369 /ASSEMBLY_ACC=CAM_ASM_000364 /LENGTH=45 /DNA_ID= /DNA_START= /DNA_END= /DNA_ORIENTATION=
MSLTISAKGETRQWAFPTGKTAMNSGFAADPAALGDSSGSGKPWT